MQVFPWKLQVFFNRFTAEWQPDFEETPNNPFKKVYLRSFVHGDEEEE
jgi:hypothetical protein